MDAPITPLSGIARWQESIDDNKNKIPSLPVSAIPGILLVKIEEIIRKNWCMLSLEAITKEFDLKSPIDTKKWIKSAAGPNGTAKIKNLLSIFREEHVREHVYNILLDGSSIERRESLRLLEMKRHHANRNPGLGLMRHLCKDTLRNLAKCMEEHRDWKTIADGLGFCTKDYFRLSTPHSMLIKWMEIDPNATRARLSVELTALNMQTACNYIRAIPVSATPKIPLHRIELSENKILSSQVTRYHLDFIERLCDAHYVTIRWIQNQKDALWQAGEIGLGAFITHLKAHAENDAIENLIDMFRHSILTERIEPVSKGGIALSQIHYLAKSDLNLPPEGPLFRFMAESSFKMDLKQWKNMSFKCFLYLYWQFNDSKSLYEFGNEIVTILKEYQIKSTLIENFKKRLADLLPMCSYDHELAAENEKNMQQKAAKVNAAAKPILDESERNKTVCVVCFDDKKEYAFIPCGHYGFCLKCIADANQCLVCKAPITGNIKIFPC